MQISRFPHFSFSLEWLFVFFSFWQVVGVFLDGWAHIHLSTQETFFTPWHLVFYSGFLAVFLLLIFQLFKNHLKGYAWSRALPREYRLSLIGCFIFLFAAFGDLFWHTFFGVEIGIEALLSPTHLLLAFAGAIIVSGPLHAIWYRNSKKDKIHKGPVLVSFCLLMLTLTFMIQFLHPYYFPYMASSYQAEGMIFPNLELSNLLTGVGIGNIIVYTMILIGAILAVIRFIDLPLGSFTLMFVLQALGMAFLKESYWVISSAFIAGVLVDIVYAFLRSYFHYVSILRFFGFIVPVIVTSSYFLVLHIIDGIWWSVHLVAGTVFIAGIAGMLLTYLIFPPGDHFIPHKF
ncbi:MAG: hypothetical protein Q7R56_00280 [Nanoarchaeota archaeon]|nr:hypothetical protein [Nanoarchaeota archaeon]